MKKNVDYRAYDISLKDENVLSILKYEVVDERDGRDVYRSSKLIGEGDTKDLPAALRKLQDEEGYLPINRFYASELIGESSNPLVQAKLILLSRNHKVLEKYYQEVHMDDISYLLIYLTLVNMDTGEISSLKIEDLGLCNEKKIELLKQDGYRHIDESFYYQKEQQPAKRTRKL